MQHGHNMCAFGYVQKQTYNAMYAAYLSLTAVQKQQTGLGL